jgi:peptidoglycan/LPS O-acetylase OafA/YrhL
MLAAYVARSPEPRFVAARTRVPWALVAALFLGTAVALATMWGISLSESRFYLLDFPVGLMAMALLIASSRPERTVLQRVFSWRPLVLIGSFSYSLYLIHAPFLQILWQYVLKPLGLSREAMLVSLMTGGLALILGISYLFFLLFEAPFMGTARRKAEGQTGVIPASP